MKKKYKHKKENATAELCSDEYWYLIKFFDKNDNEINRFSIPKSLIENTNDWELIEEPKEKVVKGWVENKIIGDNWYEFVRYRIEDSKYNTPATLILNPKKKKEYVRWVTDDGLSFIMLNRARSFDSFNNTNDYYCHKIKITVEEE